MLILKGTSRKSIVVGAIANQYETLIIDNTGSLAKWGNCNCDTYLLKINKFEDINISEIDSILDDGIARIKWIIFYVNCKEEDVIKYEEVAKYFEPQIQCLVTVQSHD